DTAHQRTHRVLVRRPPEINFDHPGARLLEGRNGILAGHKRLAKGVEEPSRRVGAGDEPGELRSLRGWTAHYFHRLRRRRNGPRRRPADSPKRALSSSSTTSRNGVANF